MILPGASIAILSSNNHKKECYRDLGGVPTASIYGSSSIITSTKAYPAPLMRLNFNGELGRKCHREFLSSWESFGSKEKQENDESKYELTEAEGFERKPSLFSTPEPGDQKNSNHDKNSIVDALQWESASFNGSIANLPELNNEQINETSHQFSGILMRVDYTQLDNALKASTVKLWDDISNLAQEYDRNITPGSISADRSLAAHIFVLLQCEALIIYAPLTTTTVQAEDNYLFTEFLSYVADCHVKLTASNYKIKLRRVIFVIADVGKYLLPYQSSRQTASELLLDEEFMFRETVARPLAQKKGLGHHASLKFRQLGIELLALPTDFHGIIRNHGVLNRDPYDPDKMLMLPKDFGLKNGEKANWNTFQTVCQSAWNPINLADPLVIASTGALSKLSFNIGEESNFRNIFG